MSSSNFIKSAKVTGVNYRPLSFWRIIVVRAIVHVRRYELGLLRQERYRTYFRIIEPGQFE